ncbi:MAG: PA2779 family protein [Gammaproteobacteria bacterium]
MTLPKMLKKPLVLTLAATTLAAGMQAPAMAGLVDNEQLAMQAELQMKRDEVRSFMAREDVRAAMLDYGVNPADVDARIDNLTEAELLRIQHQLEQMPAGGDGGVLGAILIVILIFVLLDVLGATDVFPNV